MGWPPRTNRNSQQIGAFMVAAKVRHDPSLRQIYGNYLRYTHPARMWRPVPRWLRPINRASARSNPMERS